MATSFSRLEITDGTTTVTIESSTGASLNYMLKYGGWSPNVARKRDVILGGQEPYYDVDEEMVLNIKGSSADDCYTRLDTLVRLLDQANRWYARERVSPVVIRYQPKGSNLTTYLTALILRGAAVDRAIDLPKEYDSAGDMYWLLGVTIRFVRRGLWQTVLGTDSFSGSAANSGNINSGTSGQTPTLPAPTNVSIAGWGATPYASTNHTGYLLIASDANQLSKIDASTFATGLKMVSTADAGNLADGNVCRYTPTGANATDKSNTVTLSNIYLSKTLAFYASVRNNSASLDFGIQVNVASASAASNNQYQTTPFTLIDHSTQLPRVVYLGSVSIDEIDVSTTRGFATVQLSLTSPTSVAGTPTLDIDTVYAVGADDDYTFAPYVDFLASVTGAANPSLAIRNSPTTLLNPEVYMANTGKEIPVTYDGNPAIYTKGTNVSIVIFVVANNFWRAVNNAGSAINLTPTFTRDNTYLVPR